MSVMMCRQRPTRLGAFVDYVDKGRYVVGNGDQLRVPSFGLLNANVHYDRAVDFGFIRTIAASFEVKTVFDHRYVAAANVITSAVTGNIQNPGFCSRNSARGRSSSHRLAPSRAA